MSNFFKCLVMGLMLFLSREVLAQNVSLTCISHGSTASNATEGCVLPTVRWFDGWNQIFDDKVSAAYSLYSKSRPSECPKCNRGIQWSTINYKFWEYGAYCPYGDDRVDDLFTTMQSTGGGLTSFSVQMYGYENIQSCNQNVQRYHTKGTGRWVMASYTCKPGYTLQRQFVDNYNEAMAFGYACVPPSNNKILNGVCNIDSKPEGLCTTQNPVSLGDRTKHERAVDLVTSGPRPIVWQRHYYSGSGQWTFAQEKTLVFEVAPYDGAARITMNRGNGETIYFKSTSASGSGPHTFVSTMSSGAQIQSVLTDRFDAGVRVGFDLTRPDGVVEKYNLDGQLVEDVSDEGLSHHYTYDGYNRLIKIEDDFGHFLEVSYAPNLGYQASTVTWKVLDQFGNEVDHNEEIFGTPAGVNAGRLFNTVIKVSDGSREVHYDWSDNVGTSVSAVKYLLLAVTDPDGVVTNYHYGETVGGQVHNTSLFTGKTDGEGRRIGSYQYDNAASDFVKKEWRGGDATGLGATEQMTISVSYVDDQLGNRVTFAKNASSKRVTSFGSPCYWCVGEVAKSYAYDTFGNPTTITDFNNVVTKKTYDTQNRLLTVTQAFGTPLARTVSYTYTGNLRKPSTMVEPIVVGGLAHTRTSTMTYDTAGRLTQKVVSVSSGEPSRTWLYDYNASGLLSSVTEPTGRVTGYVYNAGGQVSTVIDAVGTGLERETEVSSYSPSGQPELITYPNGLTVAATYSDAGRLLSSTVQGRGTTTYTYDASGLVETITYPDGTSDHLVYSDAAKLSSVIKKNNLGAVISTTDIARNVMNQETGLTVKDSLGATIYARTQTLNALNRVSASLGALGQTTARTYDNEGNETLTQEPLARDTSRVIDALGRLTQVTDPGLGVSQFGYDVQDQVTSATDARGVVTTYGYNGFGELVTVASPDRGTFTKAYNAAGQLVSITDPRGVVQSYTYDDLGRVIEIEFSDDLVAPSLPGFDYGDITHTFTYDSCGVTLGSGANTGMGQVCSVSDATGIKSYTYNANGQVASVTRTDTPSGTSLVVGYSYDAIGRVSSMTYPSGKVVEIAYGVDGLPVSMEYDNQSVVESITWTPMGQLQGFEWGAPGLIGDGQVFVYDQDGAPAENVSGLTTLDYTVDAAGRITGIDDALDNSFDQSFGYDLMDRLTSQTVTGWSDTLSYSYDAVGNRTQKRDLSDTGYNYAHGSTNNRLTTLTPVVAGSVGSPASVVYDNQGSVIQTPTGILMSYDATGRLVEHVEGSIVTTMRYDAAGQRVGSHVNTGAYAGAKLEVYDLAGRLIGVYAPDGLGGFTVTEELVNLDGWRTVATVRPDATLGMAAPKIYSIVTDHLQAPRAIYSPSGDLVWTWRAPEAFGVTSPNENPLSLGVFKYDGRFPGQRFDNSTGFLHNGFRSYVPSLGRYIQSDPLGLEAGWNTYAYVGGNPVGAVDPWGLDIYLQFHEVAAGQYHGKIVVYPDDKKWNSHEAFSNKDKNGRNFATFGGGPDGLFNVLGRLYGGINRPNDVSNGYKECHVLEPFRGLSENDVIEKLIEATKFYQASSKPSYALNPDSFLMSGSEYNSNGYIHGLGLASGLWMPFPNQISVSAPGYGKPVPLFYFRGEKP